MNKHRLLIFVFIITNLFSYAQSVDLKWIGETPRLKTGVSWGVPFAKGTVKKDQAFVLTATANNVIPVQTWPLAYWPDGSIKWLGCAAVTEPQQSYTLNPVAKTARINGLTVSKVQDVIHVKTGLLNCEINTHGNVLVKQLSVNGKVVANNGRLVCTLENREKWNEQTLSYEDYKSEVKEVVVEQSGPVRGVIKITGVHKSVKNGREIFPFTVRLYFYAGSSSVRVVHSFVYDGDQQKDFIKELGLVFDVPMRESDHNRHVGFSGSNGGLWSEAVKPLIGRYPFTYKGDNSFPTKQVAGERIPEITQSDSVALKYYTDFPSWNSYKLTQTTSDAFTISKRTNNQSSWLFANSGSRSSGLAFVGDVSGGLAVSLKNFWQSYPTSLEIDNARSDVAQLKVSLWSKDAEAMDLRHYDTIPHGLLATYEDVQPGLSTPLGVARTSELTLFPFDQLPDRQQISAMAHQGAAPNQLICTPEYLHAQKAFGTRSLPDRSNDTKVWIENQLDSSVLFYKRAIEEHHWYGYWNYGDVMHTYDPVRHMWRYDIGGFAWDNTELAPGNWLWYSFLRTGDADIYTMAEAMTRHTSEVDCYHIGEFKGMGSRHNVSHWGCGAKEGRIGQAAWKRQYYYLTTDERSGDLMRESLDAEKAMCKYDPLRIAQPREKFPYSTPARLRWGPDWIALVGNWMTEWERTGDKKYYAKILAGMESLTKLPSGLFTGPNGLGYDPETGKLSYEGNPAITNKNHLATIMGGYEILMELFEMIDYPAFRKTWTDYCKYYSMPRNDAQRTAQTANWGNNNFITPRLTAFAAKELKDPKMADRAWEELLGRKTDAKGTLRSLYDAKLISGTDALNPIHENAMVSTNSTAQWGLNAIVLLELIGDKLPDAKTAENQKAFETVQQLDWKPTFADDFKKSWSNNWFLDGQKAQLKTTKNGLLYTAGTRAASDADHSVLWTKQEFEGDMRIEFDFTKRDASTKFVNIIYLFAQGSGVGAYDKDIAKWTSLRTIPAMKTYFDHMNAYHISFAAFENDNSNPSEDYIRARRYLPELGKGLKGTELKPDYLRTGLFKTGIPHHITIIRRGEDIYMMIKNADKAQICRWKTSDFPALNSGRIGLRLMGSRVSEFGNFKVFSLK